MRIQHNIMAMNAYRNYNNNTSALSKNLEKLSSGYKINRAGDDAAGLAISEKMRAQITGLQAAQKNVKDGISLVKTAEGAMQEIHDMLNRMDYLATQSANGTYDDPVDRLNLQKEISSLKSEINRIADSANFNGIKLLDGSLDANGTTSITTEAVQLKDHAAVKGITVGEIQDGGGSNGVYTINIDKLFGDSDSLTFSWDSGSAFVASGAATAEKPASEGADATEALATQKTTLTFDTEDEEMTTSTAAGGGTDGVGKFTGKTKEEQAASIAKVLSQDANIAAQFDITAQGSKVILTNKNEGNDQATISSVESKNAAGTANVKAELATADPDGIFDGIGTESTSESPGDASGKFVFENLIVNKADGTKTSMEFNVGDVLTFETTDVNGNKWTAELTVTEKMRGDSNAETVDNIITALSETDDAKAIYFKANDKTAAAEETIKFSDMFTVTAEDDDDGTVGANLQLEAKDNAGLFNAGTEKMTLKNSSIATAAESKVLEDADTTNAAAAVYDVELSSAAGKDTNYSIGDKLTIEGELSDGRKFKFDMVAGTDFEVGANKSDTADNIVKALAKGENTIAVTKEDAKGNVESTEDIALNKIFSDAAGKNEIKVSNTSGKLSFTSQVAGDMFNGKINKVSLTAANAGGIQSPNLVNGAQKTAATSSVTFDSALEEGATVKVGDKTYQFVTDTANVEDGNTAIKVDDLSDSAAVAAAFAEQLNTDAGAAYTTEVDGSTVTITTADKGKDVKAISIEGAGAAHKDAVFQLQPNKLKTGSSITVNGQRFEFVDTKDADKAEVSEGSIRVNVDLAKGDKLAINEALKDAIAGANITDVQDVEMAEDGTITIHGAKAEMENFVTFDNGKALTLQIGDTSDSFNQLSVNVGDMHTWAMKIDSVDISTQEGAQAAIDVIKNAINYVSGIRGDLGAVQNRLDHTANNLSVMAENIQDAESAIRDTDVAEEMMAYTKNNILIQSAQAMLAQANQVPQGVLQLLG